VERMFFRSFPLQSPPVFIPYNDGIFKWSWAGTKGLLHPVNLTLKALEISFKGFI
jgi:hypothetical protein